MVSFYITLLKTRKQLVKEINDREETVYETDLSEIIQKYVDILHNID